MAVAVKDYLESMKTISSSTTQAKPSQSDIKLQALLSQLIEAISYANSISLKKKDQNAIAPGVNPDKETNKQILEQMKAQEKLIAQLAQGQQLDKQQTKDLNDVINKFYEMVGAQDVSYKKFAASLEKFALTNTLPEAVQNRLINDSRDAHMIGKEQQDKEGVILPILKRIRDYLSDAKETTKQFNKKLFVTIDQFREGFMSGLDKLKDGLSESGTIFDKLLDGFNTMAMGWTFFQGQFKDDKFGLGLIFKQFDNLKTAVKAIKEVGGLGKVVESVKNMGAGIKKIGKSLSFIPKFVEKLGWGKGLMAGASSLSKGIAKTLGKGVLKKVPLIGTVMSVWMAIERWKKKDYAGALIELASGVAAVFPGVGTAIAIALDLWNFARDRKKIEANEEQGTVPEAPKKPFGGLFGKKKEKDTSVDTSVDTSIGDGWDWGVGDGDYKVSGADMSNMQPKLMDKLKAASKDMKKSIGHGPVITNGFRSNRYQASLWYRGRIKREPGIYTPAPPVYDETINNYRVKGSGRTKRTGHMVGGAIDVANWKEFLPFAKKHGLSWQGSKDPVHFQINDLYEVPKQGDRVSDKSLGTIEAKGAEGDYVSGADAAPAEIDSPGSLDEAIAMFDKFNRDLVSGVSGSAQPASGGVQSPTLETISSGTPAMTTAQATTATASRPAPAPAPVKQAPQVSMPVQGNTQPSTIDTEIRDTDLALLNSILFQ